MYLFLGLSALSLALAQTCYYPDGTVSANDIACPSTPGSKHTACCGTQTDGTRAICLANNLCMGDAKLSRGSCTDSTWEDPSCPRFCLADSSLDGGWGLASCLGAQLWSCGSCSINNFTLDTTTFRFSNAQFEEMGVSRSSNTTDSTTTTTITTTVIVGSQSTPISSSTASSISSTTGSSTSSATNSPTSSPVSSTNNLTCITSPSPSRSASPSLISPSVTIVGAAVGGTLGVIILLLLGLLIIERRRNNALKSVLPPELDASGPITIFHPKEAISSSYNSSPVTYQSAHTNSPPGYDISGMSPQDRSQFQHGYIDQRSRYMYTNMPHTGRTRSRPGLMNELDGGISSDTNSPLRTRI